MVEIRRECQRCHSQIEASTQVPKDSQGDNWTRVGNADLKHRVPENESAVVGSSAGDLIFPHARVSHRCCRWCQQPLAGPRFRSDGQCPVRCEQRRHEDDIRKLLPDLVSAHTRGHRRSHPDRDRVLVGASESAAIPSLAVPCCRLLYVGDQPLIRCWGQDDRGCHSCRMAACQPCPGVWMPSIAPPSPHVMPS